MKRKLAILIIICMTLTLISGCAAADKKSGKYTVITTVFAAFDWARRLTDGCDAEVVLLNTGSDVHSYEPTAADMVKISSCDMFVYVGGSSDGWAQDILSQSVGKDVAVINMMEVSGVTEKEHDGHAHGADEHIWLSLKNAKAVCESMAEALSEKFPKVKDNAKAYAEKLSELDNEYKAVTDGAAVKTLVFADRFPFCYLLEDYGLTHHAAFSGCTSESDASFKTVVALANTVDELKLSYIIQTESADGNIAESVIGACKREGVKVLTMHSMQSGTDENSDYIGYMKDNLEVLKTALK